MSGKRNNLLSVLYVLLFFIITTVLSGCSGKKIIKFKVNSVPKGAYVLYQVVGEGIPCQGQWVYLGNTPIQGIRNFEEDKIGAADRIILRVMHRGYSDQVKEWDGAGFWKEVEEQDVIFWAPKLSLSPAED